MESIKLIMFHNAHAVLFSPVLYSFLSLTYLARTIIKISLSSLMRVIALENNHL